MAEADSKSNLRSTVKDQSGAGKIKIGELLRKAGQISSYQLDEALAAQKKSGGRLSSILLRLGHIEESTILNFLSRLHNYQPVVISREPPKPEVLKVLPYEIAKKYLAFPLRQVGKSLHVAMSEPTDTGAVENLQAAVKMPLTVCVATEKDIVDAYKTYYKISEEEYQSFFTSVGGEDKDEEPITQIDDFGTLASEAAEGMEIASFEDDAGGDQYSASDAPIIKLVNGILVKAVNDGVSDIHIEPYEKTLQVRYRMDGSLYKSMNLPLSIKNALNSRIKIMSQLDITERRVPQDGRIRIKMGRTRAVDFRVSTLPTLFGESIVLRILDKGSLNVDLTKLGFEKETFATLQRCIDRPQGLLLVTGPTGSGKTVTLYSVLNSLNSEDTKILTAEDPVEFNFKGINQVNVKKEVGMTFPAALKAFLRQDPDIIMVGEIRDMETAEIAIKAAMTGHLVFSTLHTNDCPATIGRLVDIGIPPFMLASAVTMVLSQRLARKLCVHCKEEVPRPPKEELIALGFKEKDFEKDFVVYGPKGCQKCNGGGYKGRVGLFELMEITDEVAKAISAEVPEDQLRKIAMQEGMTPLRRAGVKKVIEGATSIEEILRRTVITEESLPAYLVHPDIEEYDDGDFIIRQNNNDIDFFKLVTGAVSVIKDGKKIAEITEPGEYFGEMSAISGEPRSASITSKGRSKIKRFPGDKLQEVIQKYPDVANHLFKTVVNRLGQANNIIVKLAGDRAKRPE
ncbi:type IV-A pilus assembly ATPase PilB [Thiovibrio frasassiensis]|jgi:type IV pilus assembly protein PilB|uniref:Type IV-A pilus assembly ATPase PilB n=1 Tax=Thiovibrio frasassiensis TaxID=2984131 RepID=A0A9X4MGI0_9BACT|nr:type IV-A pilus assembly ATPase PilB [Thiovibrio frasassiensis]MDG4476821.1 type IV-A pilus assembly ATPase PilB [Thiovibrio frasassiensis]